MEKKTIFQFEALPVGRGDSFLLCDGESVFLFDGGQYYQQVANFLKDRAITTINTIICSHNDSDHANGIIGVLESSIYVEEVWIPGTWYAFIESAAQSHSWHQYLLKTIMDSPALLEKWQQCDINKYKEPKFGNKDHIDNPSVKDRDIGMLIENLSESIDDVENHEFYIYTYPQIMYSKITPFADMIRAGNRIIKIIERAWNKGCNIRFFEYDPSRSCCGAKINGTQFIPLNCTEVAKIKTYGSIIDILCLTVANQESLVFRYDSNQDGSVLFTADSNLSFTASKIVFEKPAIVTAPHHGSIDNASAYSKIQGDITWVRSDCKTKKRPCQEYARQPKRFCTLCNPASNSKQPVKLSWQKGVWNETDTRQCACK